MKIDTKKQTSLKQFQAELQKNINLSETDKAVWLKNADLYPEKLVRQFYKILKKNNEQTKKFISKAIDLRPELTKEMKTKAQNIKIKIKELQAGEKEQPPEETLETQLKQIK